MNEPQATLEKSAERPTVFVSYAREDRPFARRLADALQAAGHDPRGDWLLTSGEQYERSLKSSILVADAFVFIISPDSLASIPCKNEIAIAVESRKRILPVSYRPHGDDNRLDSAIRAPQWTLLTDADNFDAGIKELCAAIRTDFDLIDQHSRLLVGADEWVGRSRNRSYLLQADELVAAEEWLRRTSDRPDKLPQPTPLELEFIFASQSDRHRRTRRFVVIASIVALALVILAGVATTQAIRATRNGSEAVRQREIATHNEATALRNADEAERQAGIAQQNEKDARRQEKIAEDRRAEAEAQRRIATEQRDRATSRALAALAVAQLTTDVEVSMLLGLEAARAAATWEAEDALRQSMVFARQVPIKNLGRTYDAGSGVEKPVTSPDGSQVLTASGAGATIRSTDASRRVIRQFGGHWDTVTSVAFSPDGRFAATGGEDKTARLWDVRNGEMLAVFLHPGQVGRVAFSLDGDYLLSNVGYPPPGRAFAGWETKTGRSLAELPGSGRVTSVAYRPDGKQLLVVNSDQTVRIWSGRNEDSAAWSLAGQAANWSPDGRELVVADGSTAAVWSVDDRRKRVELAGHTARIGRVLFSPDGQLIASGGDDRTARIWDARSGRLVAALQGHKGPIASVAFSRNSDSVLTASDDGTARIWNARSGQLVKELLGHKSDVLSAAFSVDGGSVLTASEDHTARLWDTSSGRQRAELRHADEGVKAAFSPDGSLVATGSEVSFDASPDHPTAPVELWEAKTGRHLFPLRGHSEIITSLSFSPNGRWLLSTSQDQTARIWDVRSGRTIAEFRRHSGQGGVRCAAFSPDSRAIVTGSWDGSAKVYRCEPCAPLAELVAWARARVSRQLTPEERARYLPDTRSTHE